MLEHVETDVLRFFRVSEEKPSILMSDLDTRIAEERAKHSCLKRLDQFMYCMCKEALRIARCAFATSLVDHVGCAVAAVTHQAETYFRDATYADCPALFARWQTCLRSKLKKPEEAEEMLRIELHNAAPGHHIFRFQPVYAAEARARYGVESTAD